jgi:hypothetical protein
MSATALHGRVKELLEQIADVDRFVCVSVCVCVLVSVVCVCVCHISSEPTKKPEK